MPNLLELEGKVLIVGSRIKKFVATLEEELANFAQWTKSGLLTKNGFYMFKGSL